MDILQKLFAGIKPIWPMAAVILIILVLIYLTRFLLVKRQTGRPGHPFRHQLITLILSLAGLVCVVLVSPIHDSSKGQLLSLIGILMTAAIALSSTTFLGNIMAGLMLRAVRNFRPGDFVLVADNFGRVTEQGLFHVEIQTEDRDLTTLPNLYLVTHPVKVIRSSGTIISAQVSLGYDLPRGKVEKLLLEAAREAELQEPFMHILSLGDYSVTYRIAGLLKDPKHLLSTRSLLKERMLDRLHGAGYEIVSPTFMNTRALSESKRFMPPEERVEEKEAPSISAEPERVVFDKAEEAESLEKLKETSLALSKEIEELKQNREQAADRAEKDRVRDRIKQLEDRRKWLMELIEKREKESPEP
jgi:small conductance mechanosensitive channel